MGNVPYYSAAGITLHHGDCLAVMQGGGALELEVIDRDGIVTPSLSGNGIDAVVTDAPYNAGFDYGGTTNDRQDWATYAEWLRERVVLMERIAYGPVLVFVSVPGMLALSKIHAPHWVGGWARAAPGNPVGSNQAVLVLPTWEPCLFYGDWRGDHFRGSVVDSWRVDSTGEQNGHPCPKPLSLMTKILARLQTCGVRSVLDPFAGSGTTLRAAKDLGMDAIGIEISESYCEIAARRLGQEVLPL